ncbi:MAG: preprotein translocase subunit SecY [Candidatus Aenigmatarchaeota archaeon]
MKIPIEKISKFLPAVEKPKYKQPLNKRIMWTGIALILYFLLSHITIYGIAKVPELEYLMTIQLLLGAKFGSLMTLGIGPIVTSGILLQLLIGSKIINWDMSKPESREKFQTWSKFLAILFCFLTSIAYLMGGAIPVKPGILIFVFVVFQLAMGGIIVILLDELVSKWGIGSGISLFIAAGVGSQIIISTISPFKTPTGEFVGKLWNFLNYVWIGNNSLALINLLPMLSTILIFLIVVYAQDIGVEIPLAFSFLRGFGRTWTLKLFYTSNIPVILAAALISYLQLLGRFGIDTNTNCSFLACYDENGNVVSGIVYYLTSPRYLLENIILGTVSSPEIIRAITYMIFMSITCIIFSVFWISTSGMDPAGVAEQIESIGMQIPGYRRDKKTIESVLKKYIPYLAVLGGLFVGFLATVADFTGALGTGTGILLTVMIVYNYYEEFRMQKIDELHPIIRKIIGE